VRTAAAKHPQKEGRSRPEEEWRKRVREERTKEVLIDDAGLLWEEPQQERQWIPLHEVGSGEETSAKKGEEGRRQQ